MEKKYYLVYWEGDGGDRESYSVFYSYLVLAENEDDAWNKALPKIKNSNNDSPDRKMYGFEEMNLIK